MKKVLPFQKLMDYAGGKLTPLAEAEFEKLLLHDPVSAEIAEGLKAIYLNEQLDPEGLEKRLGKTERQLEKKIQFHSSLGNHLIELNRQLRLAAAVFAFVFSTSLLMIGGDFNFNGQHDIAAHQQGPYDLGMGMKIAP
ncbi:MAG TPA: hypothetical protein ENJ95_16970 [Bacteroidetes bacterium]|nr:hypothetical protein [Bacteroidota bacterium]